MVAAAVSTFDVPGTVRLADVSRPAKGETFAQAIQRLAAKAVINGVKLMMESSTEEVFATSASMPSIIYRVSEAGCSCKGFERFNRCQHFALFMVENGTAPADPEPEPPASALAAARADYNRLHAILWQQPGTPTTADLHSLHAARRRVEDLALVA